MLVRAVDRLISDQEEEDDSLKMSEQARAHCNHVVATSLKVHMETPAAKGAGAWRDGASGQLLDDEYMFGSVAASRPWNACARRRSASRLTWAQIAASGGFE